MVVSDFKARIAKQFGFALTDPNPNIRFLALEGLQFLPGFPETEKIVDLLSDSDRFVRWKAFQVAGILKLKSAIPILAKNLQSFDFYTRSFATIALGMIGEPTTLKTLVDFARKEDSTKVKQNVLRVLKNFGQNLPWDFIEECSSSLDVGIRMETAKLLSQLDQNEKVCSLIVKMLEQETDPHIFATLLLPLGKFAKPSLLSYLETSLKHHENRIRANAIESLGFYPFEKIEHLIEPYLKDPSNRVKANVIAIYFKNGLDKKIHWEFQKLLTSQNRWERASGAWLAGTFKITSSVDILLKLLHDDEAVVAERTAWALEKIQAPKTIDALVKAYLKANQWALSNIIRAMQGVAKPSDTPKILPLFIKERNPILKAQFIDLFTAIKDEKIADKIKELLTEGEHRIRSASYKYLGTVLPENSRELLFEGLSDPHHKVRGICADLMLKNGDFRALKVLSNSLKEQDKLQRLQAAYTLRELAELLITK